MRIMRLLRSKVRPQAITGIRAVAALGLCLVTQDQECMHSIEDCHKTVCNREILKVVVSPPNITFPSLSNRPLRNARTQGELCRLAKERGKGETQFGHLPPTRPLGAQFVS